MLLGKYYIQIKDVHIYWGERRRTTSRKKRDKESYIAIPASYAYEYNIRKGEIYECVSDDGKTFELKAAGSQSKRDFAKQFQGNGSLKILYDWYKLHNAQEGDYVVVSINDDKSMNIEFISKRDETRIKELEISGEKGKIQKIKEIKEEGFRLISLIVRNGEQEHCNIRFFDGDVISSNNSPIVSLIIGANGSGKSFILKILAEMFNALESPNALGQMKYSCYELTYVMNGDIFQFQILNRQIFVHKNGELLDKMTTDNLPEKALAVSFMLNDKFPFKQTNILEDGIYEYLGIRMTSNASWTSSMNNKLAEALLNMADQGTIWEFIDKISEFLDIDQKIQIGFEMSNADFFASDLDIRLKKYGEKIIRDEDYRSDAVKGFTEENYRQMAEFICGVRNNNLFRKDKGKIIFGMSFDMNTSRDEIKKITNDYRIIRSLFNLKIFNNMSLNIFKNGIAYSYDESSSGEKHILYSFANIYNRIKNYSLVLIDEPEISLHPNWQIKYVTFLKKVFKEYSSCHFIVASHSHYMVSDLDPNSSSLITVSTDEKGKHFETLNYSTYAWSVENILYNIFEVRTCRNYYFDMDVRELLYLISNNMSEEIARIRQLYDKLSDYILDEKDPLNRIINEAREYIRDAES